MGSSQTRNLITTAIYMLLLVSLLVACGSEALEPPRLVTQTAVVAFTPTPPGTPLISLVPTPTVDPDLVQRAAETGGEGSPASAPLADPVEVVTVWINESPDSHGDRLTNMVDDFVDQSGIDVDLVLVAPDLLPDLVQTAVVSGTLPDIIVHPFEYSAGWSADGILDETAATEALERLGRETFDTDVLNLLYQDDSGSVPAIPSDGWQRLILYRSDWFSDADLDPPGSYEAILSAAETFYQPDSVVSGIVVPTDSDLISTQQTFEHIAAANGCELIDEKGEITILHPACLEALEFYRSLINQFSPIGVQTDISSLNAFLAGRTGIIFASPAALPIIAGLDDEFKPSCPSCTTPGYLAENTGMLTDLTGSGEFATPANFGSFTSIGITTNADRSVADPFVDYWFTEGYPAWIALAPERRIPVRMGTADSPSSFIDAWIQLPLEGSSSTLADIYGEESAEQLSLGIPSSSRWGFPEKQSAIITKLHQEMVLPPLLQEMLSGYFTSSQTVIEIYLAIIDVIPFYAFPVDIAPTPEP
ncbi:MAG: extracellular solute-binding protein [Candidatus Promineifilaceae bacterium]